MINQTATVRDFSFGQFQRTHARAQTHAEAQTAPDTFTDLSDGVLALDFALTFADFDGAARQIILSIVGLVGDSREPVALFDKELAAHVNCHERTVRRWRKAYMNAWQAKNFEFISVTEGEYFPKLKRYDRTLYGLPDDIREFVNMVTNEARQSPDYVKDRRAAIERSARAHYDDLPDAPARRRKRKATRSAAVNSGNDFQKAAKVWARGCDNLSQMDEETRAAYRASAEAELRDMQAKFAETFGEFPAIGDTEQVKRGYRTFCPTPCETSSDTPDTPEVNVRVKEEDTRTPTEAAEAEATWDETFAGFNASPVRTVEVEIFDDPPPKPDDEQSDIAPLAQNGARVPFSDEPHELIYEPDSEELAEREAIEAEACHLPLEPGELRTIEEEELTRQALLASASNPTPKEVMLVSLRIRTYGKASRYGENVYKVVAGASILARNGWQTVRRRSLASDYTYMRAPFVQRSKTFTVKVEIPTDEALLSFAEEMHQRGKAFAGEFQGWPVRYTPTITHPASTMMAVSNGQIVHLPVPASDSPANFQCGGDGWGYYVSFETPMRVVKDGDFVD